MKHTYILFLFVLITTFAHSQATEGTVAYQKTSQPAAVIELPYPPDVVTASLNDYLSRKGISKSTDVKGFTTYRNTQVTQGDSSNADLYFKVERKSRQDKQTTLVSLLITSLNSTSATAPGIINLSMEQARAYLDGLVPVIEAYNLEALIKDQNEAVIKAETKHKNILKDGEGLQKRKQNLEKDILDNSQAGEKQQKEIDLQKQKLEDLVVKRKS